MRGEQFPGMKLPGQDTQTGSNNLIGVGLDGRVKISELPLTYRHDAKVWKLLIHTGQNGKETGCKYVRYEHMDEDLPVYRQHLTHLVI